MAFPAFQEPTHSYKEIPPALDLNHPQAAFTAFSEMARPVEFVFEGKTGDYSCWQQAGWAGSNRALLDLISALRLRKSEKNEFRMHLFKKKKFII